MNPEELDSLLEGMPNYGDPPLRATKVDEAAAEAVDSGDVDLEAVQVGDLHRKRGQVYMLAKQLYDRLVPKSGCAETIAGEIIRNVVLLTHLIYSKEGTGERGAAPTSFLAWYMKERGKSLHSTMRQSWYLLYPQLMGTISVKREDIPFKAQWETFATYAVLEARRLVKP